MLIAALTRVSAMFSAVCLVSFLSGCASGSYAVQMTTEDKPPLRGELVIGIGPSDIAFKSPESDFSCDGISLVAYAAPGCGSASGELRLTCSDGREITADWKMLDCTSGEGAGQDQKGREVTLLIGADKIATQESYTGTKSTKGVYGRNRLPVIRRSVLAGEGVASTNIQNMLFRIGGGYAVGFGKPQDFDYPAVFVAESKGLVITRVENGVDDKLKLNLADRTDGAITEGFIIVPGDDTVSGIVAVNLEMDTGNTVRFSSNAIQATGLPVMNPQGYVIGITAMDENGWYVFSSERLRKYLAIIDPEIAKTEPVSASSEQLRERIMTSHRD